MHFLNDKFREIVDYFGGVKIFCNIYDYKIKTIDEYYNKIKKARNISISEIFLSVNKNNKFLLQKIGVHSWQDLYL